MKKFDRISNSQWKPLFFPSALVFLFALTVFADGPSREATKAEKEYYKAVYDIFAKAVPPAPAGWTMAGDSSDRRELESVNPDQEKYPLQVEYYGNWQDSKKLQDAEQKLNQDLEALAKSNSPEISKQVEEADKRDAAHDARLQIQIQANQLGVGLADEVKVQPAVGGGQVFRSDSEWTSNNGRVEGSTWVFLGKNCKLRKDAGTSVECTQDKSVNYLAVQNILVTVQADADRAKQIISKIDWAALNKLIK